MSGNSRDVTGASDLHIPAAIRLVEDMKLVTSTVGSTLLRVVLCTVLSSGQDRRKGMVYIIRETSCPSTMGRDVVHSYASYYMQASELQRIRCKEEWTKNLTDALISRSDRAYLDRLHVTDRAAGFLPERQMPFEDFLWLVAKTYHPQPSESEDIETACSLCSSDFDLDEHAPFVPYTCGRHLLCKSCLLAWCNQKGPRDVNCPHCRTKLITDPQHPEIDRLIYGTISGIGSCYEADAPGNRQYNAWETFERCCADLDQSLSENNTEMLVFDKSIFLRGWEYIVNGALLETEQSTPLHLQPARFPEYKIIADALPGLVDTYHDIMLPTDALDSLITQGMIQTLFREFIKGRQHDYLPDGGLQSLIKRPTPEKLGLRSGFMEFLDRTLSRTLQFCHKRRCNRQSARFASEHDEKWHYHGERLYYAIQETTEEGQSYALNEYNQKNVSEDAEESDEEGSEEDDETDYEQYNEQDDEDYIDEDDADDDMEDDD